MVFIRLFCLVGLMDRSSVLCCVCVFLGLVVFGGNVFGYRGSVVIVGNCVGGCSVLE